MTDPKPGAEVRVVAAVLAREGAYLIGRRPMEKRHGGLWEFPGGKLDPGESTLDAARRELAEELALEVTGIGRLLMRAIDDRTPFVIDFVEVFAEGEPMALEHEALGWFEPAAMSGMDMAPADAAFVGRLRELPAAEASTGSPGGTV